MSTQAAPTWPAEFAAKYRAAGWWRGETFGEMLRQRAEEHPDRIAIVDPAAGSRWTYADLDRRADRLAAGFLARGIAKGDNVVVQLPNIAEFFEVIFALFGSARCPSSRCPPTARPRSPTSASSPRRSPTSSRPSTAATTTGSLRRRPTPKYPR